MNSLIPRQYIVHNFVKILGTISVKNRSINIQSVGSKIGFSTPSIKDAAGITYIREAPPFREIVCLLKFPPRHKSFLNLGRHMPRRLWIRCVRLTDLVVFYPGIGISRNENRISGYFCSVLLSVVSIEKWFIFRDSQ
ncbi:hypothetical protein CEXT_758901 [Caerostris extrusa]|uniref:Uncharacterized protein n=1 Tax=Caerostris extrusa TaxID=172846 RepID=A0AAV4SMQ1_CAEEX|nr:hypothetical protein CEXT_758901 [Caerostris extrusa]